MLKLTASKSFLLVTILTHQQANVCICKHWCQHWDSGKPCGWIAIVGVCVLSLSVSVLQDSSRPRGLQQARLLCPWKFSRQEYCSGLPSTRQLLKAEVSSPPPIQSLLKQRLFKKSSLISLISQVIIATLCNTVAPSFYFVSSFFSTFCLYQEQEEFDLLRSIGILSFADPHPHHTKYTKIQAYSILTIHFL